MQITLADGSSTDLSGMTEDQMWRLQFEQEQQFAVQILEAPKGSARRDAAVRQGYETICTILDEKQNGNGPLEMGFDRRYLHLVLKLLKRRKTATGEDAGLFEIGFGAGVLLREVFDAGFPVAGIEASPAMREQSMRILPETCHGDLLVGNLLRHSMAGRSDCFDVVYWNDVFEHIPPDEIREYLATIHRLLKPGGYLATITPNWHHRPSDVTGDFRPPRTEPIGLHLKEYTFCEVTALLRGAGFRNIEIPLVQLPRWIVLGLGGLAGPKRLFEPCLEYLPFRPAEKLCRALGLTCSIAQKT